MKNLKNELTDLINFIYLKKEISNEDLAEGIKRINNIYIKNFISKPIEKNIKIYTKLGLTECQLYQSKNGYECFIIFKPKINI